MASLSEYQNERLIKKTCDEMFHRMLLVIDESRIWLSIEEFAEYHGTSRSSVERALANETINVDNGGLKAGTDKPKAKKLIFRFFNHLTGKVEYPKL